MAAATVGGGLQALLSSSARRHPEGIAVLEPLTGRRISYAELEALSDRLCGRLLEMGVQPGDRVGLWLRKSIDAVAAIFGVLKAGAAYVPVGVDSPAARNGFVFSDCRVAAVIAESRFAADLREHLERPETPLLGLDRQADAEPLRAALGPRGSTAAGAAAFAPPPDHLAYVLYTSGSTGSPKGVMLSHRNATSFIDWCSEVFRPRSGDRFSSHAPFHFDLSILDLFLPIKHGATVVLIDEQLNKNPAGMVDVLVEHRLSFWYSTPSVLTLLLEHGGLEGRSAPDLRFVLFAGEVFPVKHLRRLQRALPRPRYFNLYGPTETNVCTYHEIEGAVPDERTAPYPIGSVCSHLEARLVDARDRDAAPGDEGELLISGPSVMRGYWQLPERTAEAFCEAQGRRWYRTGDIATEGPPGVYTFVGRRDRMVKRRGYRIELGEIEAALYRFPEVSEAAAVAIPGDDGLIIKIFYSATTGCPLSIIALKRFCSESLPLSMVPDRFEHVERLPRTSTDKTDYQRLQEAG